MTPHIEAKKEDIANIVLMPGDPLRAKYIADNFLEDAKLINKVRNMFGYTGFYKGKKITVFGSGMGIPSIGIYSYELYKFYDVDTIIRIGTVGAYTDKIDVLDVILADKAYSESTYAKVRNSCNSNIIEASNELNNTIAKVALNNNIDLKIGTIHSVDVVYKEDNTFFNELYESYGCIGGEMEAFGLFANASALNKKAACILTVSNSWTTQTPELSVKEREQSLNTMIQLALDSTLEI